MGKKNKKNKQQQPAFKPRQPQGAPRFYMEPQGPNRTLVRVPVPLPGAKPLPVTKPFQAPHHQQESMIELSDDTSPNTPLAASTGGWKPVQSAASSSQGVPATEIKITKKEQIWHEFKDSLSNKKPINKIVEKAKEVKAKPPMEPVKPEPPKKSQSAEIKWELNVLDEKEDSSTGNAEKKVPAPAPLSATPPKPQVIQGTASEIKLFQIKDKPVAVQKPLTKIEVPSSPATGNISASTDSNVSEMPKLKESSQTRTGANFKHYPYQNMVNPTLMNSLRGYPAGIPRSFLKPHNFGQGSTEPHAQNPQEHGLTWFQHPYEDPGLQVNTNQSADSPFEEQQYSPSDVYDDGAGGHTEQAADGSDSPDGQGGQKRLSAFRRLGPVSQPKKPKLTINLVCNKDQSVREVLEDEIEEKNTPVHLRKDVIESSDEIVKKYLPFWPWKRHIAPKKSVTNRSSKSVMILEQEQMEEIYEKDNCFIQVTVRGYPRQWKKEHLLDAILDGVKGKTFIPCFIEFTHEQCKFLVIRSRLALTAIHKLGFYIRKDDVELRVTISQIDLTLNHLDFIPRLVLRKLLSAGYDSERKLSLKEFTLKSDLSHFIYFPLNRGTNQSELVQLQSTVAWDFLTDLDLSHNRLTSIDGFELPKSTPKLKHLDLSFNWLDKVTSLLHSRELSLRSLKLEGNPLCHDYIDPGHYVRVVKMIFPTLTEIDGVPIHLKGDLPPAKRNYCPSEAAVVASKFLDVFFPLLELPNDERGMIEDIYDEKAVLTVTYRYSLRYSSLHRKFRNIFLRARVFDEGDAQSVEGAPLVAQLICKWPMLQHDPYTFTVDVIHHSDYSTIIRVDGILKLTSETLAEDEHLLAFTRTIVLTTTDGIEYKILNEMVYWDEPCREAANKAFRMNLIRTTNRPSLKLDSAPDEDLKEKLTEIFMNIAELDKKSSERCLELKDWNLKAAIEYFMKLVKLDDLNSLRRDLEMDKEGI